MCNVISNQQDAALSDKVSCIIMFILTKIIFCSACLCVSVVNNFCKLVMCTDHEVVTNTQDRGKPWRRKFIFAYPVYLQGILIKFVYEGYRLKFKVTGAKEVKSLYSNNVKLPSAIRSSCSVKQRYKSTCSVYHGVLPMADQMVWPPSLSCDQNWPHVTKCMHSQAVILQLWHGKFIFANLVYIQGIMGRVTYEGHQVKVTGAKMAHCAVSKN